MIRFQRPQRELARSQKEAGRKGGFVSNSSFIHLNQTADRRAKKMRVKALCRAGWCLTSWVVVGVELMVVAGVVHNSVHPEAAQPNSREAYACASFLPPSKLLYPKEPPGLAGGRLRGSCCERFSTTSGEASGQNKRAKSNEPRS
jgi:hypothetical protein